MTENDVSMLQQSLKHDLKNSLWLSLLKNYGRIKLVHTINSFMCAILQDSYRTRSVEVKLSCAAW